jgi:hypothetical protein
MERCAQCGFAWEEIARDEIGPRLDTGTSTIAALIAGDPGNAGRRPSEGRWSALEYAAHVRDVLLMLRDRFVLGLVEDNPAFAPMYRDERVGLGLYRTDTVDSLGTDLRAATAMFVRLFEAIDPAQLDRQVQYGYPEPTQRSVLWMGQQAVHEVEHHAGDIAENLQ